MKKLALFVLFVACFIDVVSAQSCTCQDSSKILFHLSFDSGFQADSKGSGVPVNIRNFPDLVSGVSGQAARFKRGKYLQYMSKCNLNKAEGSIAMWIKIPDTNEGPQREIFSLFKEDGPDNAGSSSLKLQLLNQYLFFSYLRTQRDDVVISPEIPLSDKEEWHHFVFTWNSHKGASVYLDGKIIANNMLRKWAPQDFDSFFLGAYNDNGEQSWRGAVDELYIYNREMTADEVRASYTTYRSFSAEVTVKDAFLTSSVPGFLNVSIENPGTQQITLTNLSFTVKDSANVTVYTHMLDSITVAGLQDSLEKLAINIAQPGKYTFTVSYTENGNTKGIDSMVEVLSDTATVQPPLSPPLLVTQINATSQAPTAKAGTTTVVDSPIGTYLEAGTNWHDRFAYEFQVPAADVGTVYVAKITIPDDKPRTMEVLLQDMTGNGQRQAQSGVFTGDEYPSSNGMIELSLNFWPTSTKQAFIFMTSESGGPAAIKDIRIYKLTDLPHVADSGIYSGAAGARTAGLFFEDPILHMAYGTDSDMPGFEKATDRLITYMKSFGQKLFDYPVAWYGGPMYGSTAESLQPDLTNNGQGGLRPHPDGYPAYLLKRLHAEGMKFNAGLHLHTLPSLSEYAITDSGKIVHGQETAINMNKDGELIYGNFHGTDPNYNPADSIVMKAVENVVAEVVDRYGDEPALNGISLVMARPTLFTFGSIASGYNDTNLKRFQQEAQITIPTYVANDPDRFKNSYTWLMGNPTAKAAWIDWRCHVLYNQYYKLSQIVAAKRSDLKLILNVFVHLSNNQRMADYVHNPSLDVLKEIGIDPALYANNPNLVFNYTIVPADYRWTRMSNYGGEKFEDNRTVMTAPEVIAPFNNRTDMGVTIFDRYWEDAIGAEQPLPGLSYPETPWRASTLNATGFFAVEPYMLALNNLDVTSITKGGFATGTSGTEKDIESFSKALSALPAVKFDTVSTATDPVRVRRKVVDAVVFLCVELFT
ncbi:LamG domain-containing protein [Parapedobacter sp. DT-150]|uniref:LamG domain-containing protein n=1 Tax=Parapedobacter sp. DT-150 TaxID=3396162 RepID=UPI003F1C1859